SLVTYRGYSHETLVYCGWPLECKFKLTAGVAAALAPILRSEARRFGATPWSNHQGQAQIVSIAIRSPRSYSGKVEATPLFRTWFSVDPQPASISPTVNMSIVFICAFLRLWPHHSPSGNQKRVTASKHGTPKTRTWSQVGTTFRNGILPKLRREI